MSMKRLFGGFGLLVVIALVAVIGSTNAFAYSTATDSRDTTNAVRAGDGTVSGTTMGVASTIMAVASFTANGVSLPFVGTASPDTNIRNMYQQWRHNQQNDWFYVYAQNAGTSATQAIWDYYYYTPARGYTRIAASQTDSTTLLASSALAASAVYLTTGTTVPAFWVEGIAASANNCVTSAATTHPFNCGSNSFAVQLGWGVAMQGFRNDAGATNTVSILEAADTFPFPAAGVGSSRVFYDGWVPVNSNQPSITLSSNAPTQAATGVTNATGSRNANTATSYQSIQTVKDNDGDLSGASVIWVFTSGTQTGQWFQSGIVMQRSSLGYRNGTTVTPFYQSWNEAITYTTSGAQMTTNYFTTLTVSATPVVGLRDGVGIYAVSSLDVTYNYVYSNSAKGGLTLWGRAEDWHGRSSGNVQVGTQTVT